MFKDPVIKALCQTKRLFAFADDMVLISESYSELKDVMERLIPVLREAGLEINIKKSEILSSRNSELPETGLWDSDDEDTADIVKHHRPANYGRKGAQSNNPISLDQPIIIDATGNNPKIVRTKIIRNEIMGMKIVDKFKYLGLQLSTTKE